jgi:protein TonB
MRGDRIGFAGSLLLHCCLFGIWWGLADRPQSSAKPLDHSLPLTLAMFQQAPPVRHEPAPGTPAQTPTVSERKTAGEPTHEETREVQEPAQRAASKQPALAQVTEDRVPKTEEEALLQRRPKSTRTIASQTSKPPPNPAREVKRQRTSPRPSPESRRIAQRLQRLERDLPNPAKGVATAMPAAVHARTGAQQPATATRTAKLEDEYLERLWRALERSKFYPRQARRRGAQGLVQVRFRVLRDGSFDDLEVVVGSGSRLLDEAAMQTVNKVSGTVPFPRELPKQALMVSLPITYRWQ